MARVSRRLHFIALPIYFAGTKVDLEAKSAVCTLDGYEEADLLAALQMCIFVDSLEYFRCILPYHGSDLSIVPFLRRLKRIENFISHLSSVKKVILYLAGRELDGRWSVSLRTKEDFRVWASHMGDLLNCIVQRDCGALTIVDGSSIDYSHPGRLNRMVRRFATRSSTQIPPSMSSFPSGSSRLTTLTIDSASLLVPPGVNWILAALQHSPITQLGLTMQCADQRTWITLLPRIATAAPDLTSLHFTDVDASIERIVLAVLKQFEKLTELRITHLHPRYEPVVPHAPRPALPHVSALSVPVTLAWHLMSPKDSLPELLKLCIRWRAPPGLDIWRFLGHLRSFSSKLSKCEKLPHLTLDINARAGFTAEDVVLSSDLASSDLLRTARERVDWLYIDVDDGQAVDVLGIARLVALFPKVSYVSLFSFRTTGLWALARILRNVQATASLKDIYLDGDGYALEASRHLSLEFRNLTD
ncbi:hypothetical protein MSAN_01948100 [Mycena sanguinolenta]|uniref:Uncharacterized protein n=1 Tax=Mycena sanguinolenta TaxID=230812 RepID=A0A8H6XMB6_9AGAR|nr:hypothetical protein MSAN_01948100 [Mycena sanguinolenta]